MVTLPLMQLLPGFRDFFPEECARRNYIFARWREVARRYGFVEYDGPTVESMALYEKKSGGELVGQLYRVNASADPENAPKGALRPEMTPTLARMVAARVRDYRKPLKWFCLPQFFRGERQQKGRLREFYQLNCDILGEASPSADAELIANLIDTLRAFGFGAEDLVVRLSDRNAWMAFATARGLAEDQLPGLLEVVDKLERARPEESAAKLEPYGITLDQVRNFIANPLEEAAGLATIVADLTARGLGEFVKIDLTIVRGLAYYTGVVFEVFDRAGKERAVAGGGRYDRLLSLMSDGKVDLPALGYGMGDVVLGNLIEEHPKAKALRDEWIAAHRAVDVFVVVAQEERRPQALTLVQQLRSAGQRVDFSLTPAKVGKQFQAAEQLGARVAILVGEEWPQVKVKTLATREEALVAHEQLVEHLRAGV